MFRTKLFTADAIDRRVAERIASRRQELGIDRALLDLLLGARGGTVKRLETGRRRITPAHLFGLANILDVSVDWFFAERPTVASDPQPLACGDAGRAAEARRFASLFLAIADPKIRAEIREMVRSVPASRKPATDGEHRTSETALRDASGLRRRSA